MFVVDHPEWMKRAACEGIGDMFYPEGSHASSEAAAAKRVCLSCPVRVDCLDHAMANDERWGIWGGLDERERRLRRRGVEQPDVDIDRVAVERTVHGLLIAPEQARHVYKRRLNAYERAVVIRVLVHHYGWQRSTLASALSVNTQAARRLHDQALDAGAVNLERETA